MDTTGNDSAGGDDGPAMAPGDAPPGDDAVASADAAAGADAAGGRPRGVEALRAILRDLGTDEDEIERAAAENTLSLLAIERLMVPEPSRFDVDEAARRSGLNPQFLMELWRSLGYPEPHSGEIVFTETDVEILRKVGDLVAISDQAAAVVMQVSRAIGSSIARIASTQVDLISDPFLVGDAAELVQLWDEDERMVEGVRSLLPVVPQVLEVAWRRHVQAAARRRMLVSGGERQPNAVVGFADLVGFTALSQQVSDTELAAILTQFEDLVFDVITAAGGRVVKMIGDEVMFTVAQPKVGAEIALSLVEGTRDSDELSDVRVGMSYGPVLQRESDLYGPVVNLASRATVIAYPGSVVVGAPVAEELASDPAYLVRAMRPRHLKAIGRVRLFVLRRAEPVPPGRFTRRRQALRDAVRARLE